MKFPKTNEGFARMYICLFFPVFAFRFCSLLLDFFRKRSHVFDAVILVGYILLTIMILVICILEIKKQKISNELPFVLLAAVALVFLVLPCFAFVFNPIVFQTYTKSLYWIKNIFMILLCLGMPMIAFLNHLSIKAKVLSIVISLVYAAYHFSAGFAAGEYYPVYRFFVRYLQPDGYFTMRMEIVFLLLLYLLNGFGKKSESPAFLLGVATLFTLDLGLNNPISLGVNQIEHVVEKNSLYKAYYLETKFNINWLMIAGTALLFVYFLSYLAKDKENGRTNRR